MQPTGEQTSPLADMPTIQMPSPSASSDDALSPEQSAPPAFDAEPAPTLEESAEQKEASQPMTNQPASDDVSHEEEEQPANQPAREFAPLAVGVTLIGRYEITQVLNDSAEEHIYQVIDRQGYQRCWNCGSEQNAEGDEFCIDCGASMLNVPYILHEYSASGSPATDANVLQGAIVNTFIDQGNTYAVEQPLLSQSPFPTGVQLLTAGNSDAGNVRRSDPNEDSTLVLQLQRVHESLSTPMGIFIVADGLGGHDNGQVASRMAVNVIAERMTRELLGAPLQAEREDAEVKPLEEDDLVGLLRNTIEEANVAICQRNQRDKTDMGSTLTGHMVVGEHAYIVNVGDSRTYMVRGGQIYQLTTDHSLVGQLVAGGLIEPDDVYTHPQRSQIFRSLGDKPNVQVDVFKQQLLPGDILLSCSDGLWEMIRNPQIESILINAPDPQTACTRLIDAANTNGGEDNVSAVVTFVR
jgi:serine/threonine protein phosphatase PrpC